MFKFKRTRKTTQTVSHNHVDTVKWLERGMVFATTKAGAANLNNLKIVAFLMGYKSAPWYGTHPTGSGYFYSVSFGGTTEEAAEAECAEINKLLDEAQAGFHVSWTLKNKSTLYSSAKPTVQIYVPASNGNDAALGWGRAE